ncbi:uncharacterized protein LOC127880500 isoform X3 [Dreissena polymorpha]|uniref:uncharacterized protein LOC127880500 isoform X3 n=1 Tax=Dreissena polymorpha TaxID=45954 RepID=UPI002263F52C|nr:uncharacterized protein LOC127880500 isoform X3 [Dreissena polymorpha]
MTMTEVHIVKKKHQLKRTEEFRFQNVQLHVCDSSNTTKVDAKVTGTLGTRISDFPKYTNTELPGNTMAVDMESEGHFLRYHDSLPRNGHLNASVFLGRVSGRNKDLFKVDLISDTESVLSTELNRREYFHKLKEFENELKCPSSEYTSNDQGSHLKSAENTCENLCSSGKRQKENLIAIKDTGVIISKQLDADVQNCISDDIGQNSNPCIPVETRSQGTKKTSFCYQYDELIKTRNTGDDANLLSELSGVNNANEHGAVNYIDKTTAVTLEDVIHEFLNYFQSRRQRMDSNDGVRSGIADDFDAVDGFGVHGRHEHGQEKNDGNGASEGYLHHHPSMSGQASDLATATRESPDKGHLSESCPSPPPRKHRGQGQRSRLHTDVGHANSPRDSADEEHGLADGRDAGTFDDNVTARSPSLRKRDTMMRRYHSAMTLPSGKSQTSLKAQTDMNRNHIWTSKESVLAADNGYYEESTICRVSRQYDRSKSVPNGGRISPNGNGNSGVKGQNLCEVDIVGESYEARFPWQRDISTQCNILGYRDSISSSSSTTEGGCSTVSSGIYVDCQNCDSHHSPVVSRRQSAEAVRQRYIPNRNRRPKSMTCIETGKINSEMNYQGSGHMQMESDPVLNRKRMPLMVSEDPGSVSDLESILENPSDSFFDIHRTGSLDSKANINQSNLSRLKIRTEKFRTRSLSASLSEVASNQALLSDLADNFFGVLPSPRVSPEMFSNVPDVVVNTDRGGDTSERRANGKVVTSWNRNYLSVPRKTTRRLSSGSINSGSEESDQEASAPAFVRRGRRSAIVDTKNFGDVSPTTLSPDLSPSNSCDEGESGSNLTGRMRRRRSSLGVPMNVYPGDLLVQEHHKKLIKRNTISDFFAGRNGAIANDESKKHRQSFSLLKLMKTRSKESLHLCDVLKELKPSEFKDNYLAAYKNVHWTDLIASTDKQTSVTECLNISETERKRRESVWELFKSECVFLIDHLMVLKHCFLEPLKKVQVEGFLMYTEPSEIFSNLDELCYVSYTFCKDFIGHLLKDMSSSDFGSTAVLIKAFQRFSNHSKDGSVYHTYCLNYSNALSYLEKLRKVDDFCEFEKWCEQDGRCNRLQLVDLLIGPMQHCTKLPLLLQNIQKYTEDPVEKQQIVDSIEKVETSLRRLEEKMMWLKNFERVQAIQRHLVWPSITDLDSRTFIPEYLRPKLSRQPCERLLACPSRQLIHEGSVTLTGNVYQSH